MEYPGPTGSQPPPEGGVLTAIMTYVGSITRHVVALGSLARLESKEALANLLRVVVYAILGLIFGILGYLILLLFLAFLLENIFGLKWIWTTLVLAAGHFLLVGICAWNVRVGFQTPMFTATMREIRHDVDILTRKEGAGGVYAPPGSAGEAQPTQPYP